MSRDTQLRVLCYDISDDRRRRKIAAVLEDHATRVQESVFEARLTMHMLQCLSSKVAAILQDNDSFRVYTVGRAGERSCGVYGQGVPIENESAYWLI